MSNDERFFIDHGTIHDRATGRHIHSHDNAKEFGDGGIDDCCALLNGLVAARDAASERVASLSDELRPALATIRDLRAKLRVVNAGTDDVWRWQGDGDDPESLSCPVVMSAETLRSLVARAERADSATPRADAVTEAELAEIEARARACAPEMMGSVVDTFRLAAALRAERARTQSIAKMLARAADTIDQAADILDDYGDSPCVDDEDGVREFVVEIRAALAAFPEAG